MGGADTQIPSTNNNVRVAPLCLLGTKIKPLKINAQIFHNSSLRLLCLALRRESFPNSEGDAQAGHQ